MAARSSAYILPSLIVFWLAISTVIVIIDALVVILRPRTLPGGDLNYLFKPYNLYFEVDKKYLDMEDTFGIGQAWMNIFEAFLNIVALVLHTRSSVLSAVVALVVCTMTWSKTILYFLTSTELCGGAHYLAHNSWQRLIMLYYLLNGIWIVMPFICMVVLMTEISQVLDNHYKAKKKN